MHTPVLETDRLILRAPGAADLDAMTGFFGSDFGRFYGGPMDAQDAWYKFAAYIGQWTLRGYGLFAITVQRTGDTVGMAGLTHPAGQREPEMSWLLTSPDHTGKGFAVEAARAVLNHLFATRDWTSLPSFIHPENTASARLAERLGAVRDPATPSEIANCETWRHHRGAA